MTKRFLLLLLFLSGFISPEMKSQVACFTVIDPASGAEGEYEGCAPFRVEVQKCPSVTANHSYWFFFPDSLLQAPLNQVLTQFPDSFSTTKTVQTYSQVGTYHIAQYVNGASQLAIKTIRVFDSQIKPAFSWEVCGKKLSLRMTDDVFSRYNFSPGDGSPVITIDGKTYEYTFASALASPYSVALSGVRPSTCNKDTVKARVTLYDDARAPVPILLEGTGDTLSYRVKMAVRADETYGFELAPSGQDFASFRRAGREEEANSQLSIDLPAFDGNGLWNSRLRPASKKCFSGPDSVLPSPHYWNIFWPRCRSENQKITVQWPVLSIPGLVKFELIRDGQKLAEPDPASGQFTDSAGLLCGSSYAYRFRTEVSLPGGGLMAFLSPEIVASAISDQPGAPLSFPTATVLPSGIRVSARPSPQAVLYRLYRKERSGTSYAEIENGFSSLPILDQTAALSEKGYCYRIAFDDVCGNRSLLSDSICPVFLKVKAEDGGSLFFDWTSLDGWKEGVIRYELIRMAGTLKDVIRYSGPGLAYEQSEQDKDAKKLVFQVRAVPAAPGIYPDSSYSNKVEIIQESRFRFPDAFTPNNDGINDVFRCYGSFLKSFQLIIYNAWGNVVYSSDKPDAVWDGKIDGQQAQTGNYAFRAIATDEAGERMEKSGFISLIR